LRAALTSVRGGSVQPSAIIVSDDGRDEQTRLVAEAFGAEYVSGPMRGLGANRNNCLSHVRTDTLAFIDDDVIVPDDFVRVASGTSRSVITTGWELNFSFDPPKPVRSNNASFLGHQTKAPDEHRRSIVINATVFPFEVFSEIKFDERTRYGYEEIDVARASVAQGWSIAYDDDLWVEHHPSTRGREQYNADLEMSRLYLTRWAYYRYEGNRTKSTVYAVVAGLHLMAGATRRRQPLGSAWHAVRAADSAFRARVREEAVI
jgi:glycosyltransferase involved in cell wall biosynthesis